MTAKILTCFKFTSLEDLALFAEELQYEWNEKLLESDKAEDADEAFVFFEECINRAGVFGSQRDYVLYKLGY